MIQYPFIIDIKLIHIYEKIYVNINPESIFIALFSVLTPHDKGYH